MSYENNKRVIRMAVTVGLVALFATLVGMPVQAQSCVQPPTGMVGWWPGDGNTTDIAGRNPGTLHNGTGFAPGMVADAFSFDGIDDYMSVPDDVSLRASGELTIDFWARFDTVPRTGIFDDSMVILEKAGATFAEASDDYLVYWRPDREALDFKITDSCDGKYHYSALLPMPTLQPGELHHYAVTAVEQPPGSDTIFRFFVDGIEQVSIANSNLSHACGWAVGATGDLHVGTRSSHFPDAAPMLPFHGMIDELEIFDRALSASEVQAIYNAGSAGKCKTYAIEIDIKPDSENNSINPKNKGVIPVAILSTDAFDATTVDPLSVRFGNNRAAESHNKGHVEDVDADGDLDLLLHFKTQETGIECGEVSASLIGTTSAGHSIEGFDAVNTVGCKKTK